MSKNICMHVIFIITLLKLHKMDNQQLNPEQGRVQRSSRKRVLDLSKYLVWETPCIKNKIYIYTLSSSEDNVVRYVGITNEPLTRLSHHTSKSCTVNNHKCNWIKKVLCENHQIIMTLIDSTFDLEQALQKEEFYIDKYDNLTNHVLKSTHPGSKICYLYNIFTQECLEFISLQSAASYLQISSSALYDSLILSEWLMSFDKDFKTLIKEKHRIKGKNIKTNEICYFLTQQHAAIFIKCSTSLINQCIMKLRKSAKGYLFCKRNETFTTYINKHESPVICITDGLKYNTIKEAAKYYDIDESCIAKVCKGSRKHVSKLDFKYYEDMIQPLEKS